MMIELKNKYEALEQDVLNALTDLINKSHYCTCHVSDCKAIQVSVFDYTELAIVNDRLTFLDDNGMHYSLYAECSLEDLIDILVKHPDLDVDALIDKLNSFIDTLDICINTDWMENDVNMEFIKLEDVICVLHHEYQVSSLMPLEEALKANISCDWDNEGDVVVEFEQLKEMVVKIINEIKPED